MKTKAFFRAVLLTSCLFAVTLQTAPAAEVAAPASSVDPYANETPAQRDARMQWWREARFGMFIHWGVYSVPAGTYNGRQIQGIGEWIMNRGKIPVAEYREYAKQFNPVKYNADDWAKLAKDAGMKYIVITSKHHDGFAMFDSKASDWNIVKASPFGRDPLKELAAACRKYGLKLGFYYSQAQDWNNGGSASGGKWDPAQERDMADYIEKVAVPQVREILSNYGEFPSVLWWDTPTGMNRELAEKLIPLLKLKPGIIHNNRLGGGFRGDTETPEQYIPATGFPGRDFEVCMTMNGTWGFKSYDDNWKSTEMLIRNIVDIASKGGNYLLNVGPTSEGLIPGPSIERLKAIGQWMKVNSEAIYATTASPFKRLPWGRATKKLTADGATLYLHVFNWPADGKLVVPGLKNKAETAYLLGESIRRVLPTANASDSLSVTVPATAPDPISSTIVLRIKGALDIEQMPPMQEANGSIQLPASDAVLHGDTIKYDGGGRQSAITSWTKPEEWAEWSFIVSKPGKFTVTAELAATQTNSIEIAVGGQKLTGAVRQPGTLTQFRTFELGTIEISSAGKSALSVKAVNDGWSPVNVRAITLKPAN